MGTNYSPRIVTDNLLLAIDAANPKCMKAGDTTCKNLVSRGLLTGANGEPGSGTHTPDANNFPEYNSLFGGVFDFAGGRGMNVEEDLGSQTAISISMWFFKNNGDVEYFADGRNNGGQWFLSNYTSKNINFTDLLEYNFQGTSYFENPPYSSTNAKFLNRWIHMVVKSDSSGSALYLNGRKVNATDTQSFDEDIGKNYRIGTRYTTSAEWKGFMGPIFIYNRALTDEEVRQNFEAHRGRYGANLLTYI
jgi:hypothetical protein